MSGGDTITDQRVAGLGAGSQCQITTSKIEAFLAENEHLETPFLVVDLDVVARRYRELAAALPDAEIFYAVKANPAPEILRLVAEFGGSFDVASPGEIEMCFAAGARPDQISYGNTIKKRRDIASAYRQGVRMFAFDSDCELDKLIAEAPGSTVWCRVVTEGNGADWPLSRKFGCEEEMALELLERAARAGMRVGISFHVGSQQRDPGQWDQPLRQAARIFGALAASGIEPAIINIGGGFPASELLSGVPAIDEYAAAIRAGMAEHLPDCRARVIAEPGRYLVSDAGVLRSEVVLVSRKSVLDRHRWVYLDVGVFGGLAETLDESIRYRIRTPHDGSETGPVAIAGPTCDSVDILYQKTDYRLPLRLAAGDHVDLLSTGAYTTTYSSVGFNGFPPLRAYCI